MIVQYEDVVKLVDLLRMKCPVDTGNLRDNGIGGVQVLPDNKGYIIQIGFPATKSGAPATEDYALFTEIKNKSSLGWVKASCELWATYIKPRLELQQEGGIDQDVL